MKSTALAEAHQKFYSVAPLLLHASTLIASSWKLGDVLLDVLRALGTVEVSNGIVTATLINGEVWDFTVPMKKDPVTARKMKYQAGVAQVGAKVYTTTDIITEGDDPPDRQAEFPESGYIHALRGDTGEVIHVRPEDGCVTVRFDRTGTATIVGTTEVAAFLHQDRKGQ